MKVAILLSLSQFEGFYGKVFNLSRKNYLATYRNDFSWEYAAGFSALNVDTFIYLPSNQPSLISKIDERISVRFLRLQKWWFLWERIDWLSRTPIGRYMSEVCNAMAFWPDLRNALVEDGITHLYVQEYWTGRFDYLVRKCKVAIIGADHGGKRRRQISLFKKNSFKKAAFITCQTLEEANDVRIFGGIPHIIPNGIDVDYFVPGDSNNREKYILTVARLTDNQKKISDLIKSIEFLPLPWRLIIAGSGPDEEELLTLVRLKSLESRVTFAGFVRERGVLRSLYQRCSVFALVSAHEGLPLAALEAMSCGCPVVVSDISAFKDLVDHGVNGLKIKVGDIFGIAEAIESAYDHKDVFSIAARRKIETTHSLARMSKTIVELMGSSL